MQSQRSFVVRMHELSTFHLPSMGQILLLTICVFGVGFLTWFLVALMLDEKRMRAVRCSGTRKTRTFSAPMRIDSTKVPRKIIRDENSDNSSKLERRAFASQLETPHPEHFLPL